MTIVPGKVVNGRIELVEADDFQLPEGAEVRVYYDPEGAEYIPTPEEAAELEESLAQIERGEWVDGDEFLAELRRRTREP
jgi:hypothetical protein